MTTSAAVPLFHGNAHLRVLPEAADRISGGGFQALPLPQVKKPVESIPGQGDLILLPAEGVHIPPMGAVPHRPEAVELVHQKVDEFLGAAVKLLDAVVQRQIFPVAFRLPIFFTAYSLSRPTRKERSG